MIVYTPTVAGQIDDIENVLAQIMAESQLVLDNSNTGVNFNLVHSQLVSYTETGDSYLDLDRLRGLDDGYMDEVHSLREQYGADLVMLYAANSDTGGVANLPADTQWGNPDRGFSLINGNTGYVAIHEWGHNMGCGHHYEQNSQPGPGLFSYSSGSRWTGTDGGNYCSVVTYGSGLYYADETDHLNVPYFSNPDISYMGVATGDYVLEDNARTIRETKHIIAAYSDYIIDTVYIPDANFKAALVGNPDINTNNDTEIQVFEALSATEIEVSGLNISDLTGIEAFKNLWSLNCENNNLTILDVSQNQWLINLSCGNNNLEVLDVSQNLTLINLLCNNNDLTTLEIYQNPALSVLACGSNNLTALDVSQNQALTVLSCSSNDIVILDVSQNPELEILFSSHNLLTSLNIASGNNQNLLTFSAVGNPELVCIQVDADIVGNIPQTWSYGSGVEFSVDCALHIEDKFAGKKPLLFPNPTENIIHIELTGYFGEVLYEVYSINGQLVISGSGNKITLQDVLPNLYFVKIKTENTVTNHKVIKL